MILENITKNLLTFLQRIENDFDIPQTYLDGDFKTFLEGKFEVYLQKLNEATIDNDPNKKLFKREQIEIANLLAFKIIETLDFYYKGQIKEAHDTFFNQLNKVIVNDKNISELLLEVQGLTREKKNFYRITIVGKNEQCDKNRIFHIPFSKRHLVVNQRFSINGFPCLYLGDTIKICLDELGICFNNDSIENTFCSQFSSTKELKFLKLNRIKDIYKLPFPKDEKMLESHFGTIANFILTYPLVLACLVKVKQSKGKFKPEYIIPQMLLQYVKNDSRQLDGICYPSTKMNYEVFQELTTYNFVMPPRVFKNDYCEYLRSHFLISNPQPLKNIIKPIQNTNYKNSIYQTIEDNLSKFQAE